MDLYITFENTMSIRVDICEILIHCIGATPSGGASCLMDYICFEMPLYYRFLIKWPLSTNPVICSCYLIFSVLCRDLQITVHVCPFKFGRCIVCHSMYGF